MYDFAIANKFWPRFICSVTQPSTICPFHNNLRLQQSRKVGERREVYLNFICDISKSGFLDCGPDRSWLLHQMYTNWMIVISALFTVSQYGVYIMGQKVYSMLHTRVLFLNVILAKI